MFKSFIIVLDNHPWGNELFKDAFSSGTKFGWNLEKFSAVDGRTTNLQSSLKNNNLRLCTNYKKPLRAMERPGVYGNFLTHYKLWNLCIDLNEPIGCFEHDVIFNGPPNGIDMSFEHLLKFDKLTLQKYYGTGNCWNGAHAYIIKPEGAKKLISWSKQNGVMPTDVMIGTEIVNIAFNNNCLISFNPKQEQNNQGYTIHSTSKTITF